MYGILNLNRRIFLLLLSISNIAPKNHSLSLHDVTFRPSVSSTNFSMYEFLEILVLWLTAIILATQRDEIVQVTEAL